MDKNAVDFLGIVDERLTAERFARVDAPASSVAAYHRRKWRPLQDFFNHDWVFGYAEDLDPDYVRSFAADMLNQVREQGNFGSKGVVYTVLVTPTLTAEAAEYVKQHAPSSSGTTKGRMGFPVAVGLQPPTVAFLERTPTTAALLCKGFRKSAARICSP